MIQPSDLAICELFDGVDGGLVERIATRAADVRLLAGEWLVREGDAPYFWIVLEGQIETLQVAGGVEQQLSFFEPGEFVGEVPLMLGASAFVGMRALTPARVARIEPLDFHALISASPEAGATIARTLSRRVQFLSTHTAANAVAATIVGDRFELACHGIRDFLSRNQIVFEWLDPTDPSDATCIPESARGVGPGPIVLLRDGTMLVAPSTRELAGRMGLQTLPSEGVYDVVIVGGGPAGLAAGVYGGSEGLRTIMVEREAPGGQAGTSSRIENYLGFPGGVSGGDLANRALTQAKRFGVEVLVTRSVESVERHDHGFTIRLDGSETIETRTVVVATGVAWRRLDAAGDDKLVGRGVYYGAARTEALRTRGKDVFVVGGGNSAGQGAMYFANYARSVTLLIRGESLAKTMSHYLIEQLATKSNVAIEARTVVAAVDGDEHLETVTTRSVDTGVETVRLAGALFVFIGADTETAWLPASLERDAHGFIRTGRDIETWSEARPPYALETSVPGIFAAGDVRAASVKRVASSVGEGSMAIAFIHEYLALAAQPAPAR